VRCMAGRGSAISGYFVAKGAVCPQWACHDKFGDGLACPGRHLTILQRLRQGSGIARVTDGECGDRFPTPRESQRLGALFPDQIQPSGGPPAPARLLPRRARPSPRRCRIERCGWGRLFFANASCATAIASTGALLAQLALNSTRNAQHLLKIIFVVPRCYDIRPRAVRYCWRAPSGQPRNAA